MSAGARPRRGPRAAGRDAALARVGAAVALLRAGRIDAALRDLEALVAAEPRFPPAREVLACALDMAGDREGAAREMREAARLDPADPAYPLGLGQIVAQEGRLAEAEAAWRAALAIDPDHRPALERLARLLLDVARPEQAVELAARWAALEPASAEAAALLADAREAAGDLAGAAAAASRGVAAAPGDPDGWARLGRLQQAEGALDAAEASLARAVALKPNHQAAHAALADLVWMRTGDAAAALAPVSAALARMPAVSLLALKVRLTARLGDPQAAYAIAAEAAAVDPRHAGLHAAAAAAAGAADRPRDMLRHAEALAAVEPSEDRARMLRAEAYLRLGEFRRALPLLDEQLARAPYDQNAVTARAMAWRALGDPRYGEVYDYEQMVRGYTIEPPPGWTRLADYLADLASSLDALHRFEAAPLDQSLRGGTQTTHDLSLSTDPVVRALFTALRAPVEAYLASLGPGPDPLRARARGGWRIAGAWSARLRPGGFHVSHLHPDGWLSSAFHVEVPDAAAGQDRQGWLQFGDPGARLFGNPGPDYFVRPEPGRLVVFPSYMLHGTRPFGGEAPRLAVAFDAVPSPAP